jgi:hypothetical protein
MTRQSVARWLQALIRSSLAHPSDCERYKDQQSLQHSTYYLYLDAINQSSKTQFTKPTISTFCKSVILQTLNMRASFLDLVTLLATGVLTTPLATLDEVARRFPWAVRQSCVSGFITAFPLFAPLFDDG